MSEKESRHDGCLYREFCTKEDKWCPYLTKRGYNQVDYEKNYIIKP